jgi:hypothetical protein
MATDKTPRDDDETLALPVTDPQAAADETAVLPVDDTATGTSTADTTVLPVGDTATGTSTADTTVLALDETRPLPVSEPEPVVDPVSASPIGVFYTPAERPAVVDDTPVAQPTAAVTVEQPRRRLRVGTVVWGLVIAAIGVGLLAWAAGVAIDVQLAMIVLLAAAGTALLVGSIVSGARNARR